MSEFSTQGRNEGYGACGDEGAPFISACLALRADTSGPPLRNNREAISRPCGVGYHVCPLGYPPAVSHRIFTLHS